MIKSMTGFGRSELKAGLGFIRVEIKTTNHKFLEVSSRLPFHLTEFEDKIRKLIGEQVRRGKVHLFISSPDPESQGSKLVLNEPLAREVSQHIRKLKKVLDLKSVSREREDAMVLKEVLHYPNVLMRDVSDSSSGKFAKEIDRVVSTALRSLDESRKREGLALEKDFLKRVSEIDKALTTIEKRIPMVSREYKHGLEKKIKEHLQEVPVDKERLTLEVAQFIKNSDISEEITRLRSHIVEMKKTLKETGEVGRKIDFIGQEMYRESNTIGAKSNDMVIASNVIALKSAVEKIREQSQNIE